MKKNTLVMLFLTFTSLANAEMSDMQDIGMMDDNLSSAIDKKIELIQFKKAEKDDWFNFRKKYKAKIVDLMKKHHNECFDLEIKSMKEVKNMGFTSEILESHIRKALELNKKQSDECAELYRAKSQEAMRIKAKHDRERKLLLTRV